MNANKSINKPKKSSRKNRMSSSKKTSVISPKGKIDNYLRSNERKTVSNETICTERKMQNSPICKQTNLDSFVLKKISSKQLFTPKKGTMEDQIVDTDTLYLSPSARLDSSVPKVENILQAMEDANRFKEIKELIKCTSEQFLNSVKNNVENIKQDKPKKYKDCKHMTDRSIENKFEQNAEYLDNIFNGLVYNERHELFKNDTPLNNFTELDLRMNDATSVFRDQQLIFIVSLFRKRYDNGNIYKHSDYYFKVLLPEFCLKVFMDYHIMSKTKAMEYLKSLPIKSEFLG